MLTSERNAGIRESGIWLTQDSAIELECRGFHPSPDPGSRTTDPGYRKMPFGILTCTPTFWSTSWVMTTLPATLVSW